MSETVSTPAEDESPEAAEAEATPPAESIDTIKRRLAGKDQALSRTSKERDEFRSEADRLRAKIAEYEQANMTELERIQKERDTYKALAAQAQEEARKHALARKSPVYAEYLDLMADLDPNSEDAAQTFEQFIARFKAPAGEPADTGPEPRIDPNRPRKQAEPARPKRTADEIKAEIEKLGTDVLLGR